MTAKDGAAFIGAAADNKTEHSNTDCLKAVAACALHKQIGPPSLGQHLPIIDKKELRNCRVTCADALAAKDTFGLDIRAPQGKTVC